jgi:hypothetical protein
VLAAAVNGILLARSPHAYVAVAGLCVIALAAAVAAGSTIALRDPDSHGWLAASTRRGYTMLLIAAVITMLDVLAISG